MKAMSIHAPRNLSAGQRAILALALLGTLLLTVLVFRHLFPGTTETGLPRVLKVAAPNIERVFPKLSPFGPGIEVELLDAFAAQHGIDYRLIPVPSFKEGFSLLDNGGADVVLALGWQPQVEDEDTSLHMGPAYQSRPPLVLTHTSHPEFRGAGDFCNSRTYVQLHPGVIAAAEQAASARECSSRFGYGSSVDLRDDLPRLNTDSDMAVVDQSCFDPFMPFAVNLRPASTLKGDLEDRWVWLDNDSPLDSALVDWWSQPETMRRAEDLLERYRGFLPGGMDYYELQLIGSMLEQRFPRYREMIRKVAREYGWDPLLLTALIQQESHFNPGARSHTGVRGLMQVTLETARAMGIENRNDPEQSLVAGAGYLRKLWDQQGADVDYANRLCLTLAAYNQGPGSLRRAQALAQKRGWDPNRWSELKKAYPLVRGSRGREAVVYVDRVRLFYYTFRGLAILSSVGLAPWPQANELAPLLGGGLPLVD